MTGVCLTGSEMVVPSPYLGSAAGSALLSYAMEVRRGPTFSRPEVVLNGTRSRAEGSTQLREALLRGYN